MRIGFNADQALARLQARADLAGYGAQTAAQLDHCKVRQQIPGDKPNLRGLVHVQPQLGTDLRRNMRRDRCNAYAGKRDSVSIDHANQASERFGQPVLHARPGGPIVAASTQKDAEHAGQAEQYTTPGQYGGTPRRRGAESALLEDAKAVNCPFRRSAAGVIAQRPGMDGRLAPTRPRMPSSETCPRGRCRSSDRRNTMRTS